MRGKNLPKCRAAYSAEFCDADDLLLGEHCIRALALFDNKTSENAEVYFQGCCS